MSGRAPSSAGAWFAHHKPTYVRSQGVDAGVVVRDDKDGALGNAGAQARRRTRRPRAGPQEPLPSGSGSWITWTATLREIYAVARRPKPGRSVFTLRSGAGDEARTRDPYLGKVMPYVKRG
jgi:hypothetical protein